jgi:hypothetical protein
MIRWIQSNASRSVGRRLAVAVAGVLLVLASSAAVYAATTPDFSITVTPSSQTVNAGYPASYTVALLPSNGFSGTVTLNAGNLPKSSSKTQVTTASWTVGSTTYSNPTTVTVPPGSQGVAATLTISGGQPATGAYAPTVTATSGSLSHTQSMTLVVISQNAPNFGLSVSPSSQTVVQGGATTSTVSISRENWTGGSVSLGPVSGLPFGATATFNPTSTTGSSATMNITAGSATSAGFYTVTVNGSGVLSGSTASTRSTAFTLVVQNATSMTAAAPTTDATNTTIPAGSISSTLAGSSSGATAATGTITFKVFGPQATAPTSCTTGGTTVGTATVNGNGTYSSSKPFTPTAAGTYWWYASYSGDTYNKASASACNGTMAATVVKNTTGTTAAGPASAAATGTIAPSAIGSALTGATSSATGTLTFKVFGPQASAPTSCTTGGTTVGTATVNGNATYNPSAGYTPSVGGTYWWYASYSGDTLNSPSSSPCGAGMASTVVQDFTVGATPSSQSALTGGTSGDSATYTTTITPIGGYTGTVNLSVSSGLPTGASSTPTATASTSTLTINLSTTVAPGTYTLTIQGQATISGTTVTRTTQVTLIVQASQPFQISGTVPSPLYPGAPAQTFPVTITNPNSFSIHVTSLGSVGITPVNAPMCQSSWFQVTLPSVPSGGISVGANGGTATVTASAQMLDSGTNQDACRGKQLTLTYTGTYGK